MRSRQNIKNRWHDDGKKSNKTSEVSCIDNIKNKLSQDFMDISKLSRVIWDHLVFSSWRGLRE